MATETAQQRQDRENYESAQAWQRQRNAYLLTLAPTVEQGEAIAQANAASAAAWQRERDAFLASQAAPAASAYTQQYIPGNRTPILIDENTGFPLPMRYGDPIYSAGTGRDSQNKSLIGRVGMIPIVTSGTNSRGEATQTIAYQADPAYQKSQQMLDFEKKIASGEVQSSGLYGPALDGGRERRAFAERESAYTSYDPATNIVKFYDPEGNVTQEGQRTSSGGGVIGGLMTGFNQTVAQPDFQKAVMLAALATAGYGALAGGAGAAAGSAAVPNSAAAFGGSGSLFEAAPSVLASGAEVGTGVGAGVAGALPQYSVNQAIASGMSPGSMGASLATDYATMNGVAALPSTALNAAYGVGGATAGAAGAAGLFSPFVNVAGIAAGSGVGSAAETAAGAAAGSAAGAAATGLSAYAPSLISGGLGLLGAANTAEKAREAAQIQAAAQVEAARIAADAAKFRPVGVTTRFGASNFQTDAQGNVIGAGYTASPEIQAYQNRLSALAAQGLTGAEGAQAAYAPLTTGAQSLFNLGQGYIQQTPEQQAADYIAKQQALLAPGQERQLAQLQNTLLAQGRGGLSVAQGGNMAATSPELAAYYNALAQSNLQLAAQGQQAGQQQAQFGAGLLGTGSDLMGKYYGGQTAAYAPFATAIDTSSGLERLAQQPLTLGTQIGAQTTAASAEAGRLLSQGMISSAATQAPANAFSQSGNILSQFGSNPQFVNALNTSFGVTDPNQVAMQALLKKIYGT